MRLYPLLFVVVASPCLAAPISVICNGHGLDPQTGRQAIAGVMSFSFKFDEDQGTMLVQEPGAVSPQFLVDVSITPSMARGSDRRWVYELNRVDGTVSMRADLKYDAAARQFGLGGDYFRGTCAKTGATQF